MREAALPKRFSALIESSVVSSQVHRRSLRVGACYRAHLEIRASLLRTQASGQWTGLHARRRSRKWDAPPRRDFCPEGQNRTDDPDSLYVPFRQSCYLRQGSQVAESASSIPHHHPSSNRSRESVVAATALSGRWLSQTSGILTTHHPSSLQS